ncbi:hypothetical protein D3C74_37270 [compost metagenome]
MDSKRKTFILQKNIDFFTAALSQTTVSVWQEDATGVYCEISRGCIEMFSDQVIRIANPDHTTSHYERSSTMFQAVMQDKPI